jgi:hypothetical protein
MQQQPSVTSISLLTLLPLIIVVFWLPQPVEEREAICNNLDSLECLCWQPTLVGDVDFWLPRQAGRTVSLAQPR